jgi:hypothetical protein
VLKNERTKKISGKERTNDLEDYVPFSRAQIFVLGKTTKGQISAAYDAEKNTQGRCQVHCSKEQGGSKGSKKG